jgi:hypothetical protein
MDSIENEIWRMVPPEEKFELLARAQSKGVFAALIGIIVLCTMAVGLKIGALMWTSFVISPFVFQFACGKEWRAVRPRTLLEYLAARSASRRYAFSARAKDLSASMIFKGTIEQVYDNEHVQEAMEAIIANNAVSKVWISLFGDAFTMIAEKPGGAELKLAQLIDDRVKIYSENKSETEYTNQKALIIKTRTKDGDEKTYKVKSRYPAALVVFEKRVKQIQAGVPKFEAIAQELVQAAAVETSEDDDKFNNLFSF